MVKWLCVFKRDLKSECRKNDIPGLSTVTGTLKSLEDTSDKRNDADDEEYDDLAPDICCLRGCVSSIIIAVLIFVVLPAGILVIVYSSSNNDHGVLAAGIILIGLPMVVIPMVAVVLLNRRRINRIRKRKVSATSNLDANANVRF